MCRFALVRGPVRLVTAAVHALESLPKVATALTDIQATLRHVERLTAYIAQELPELIYQLEQREADVNRASPRSG